MRYKVTPGARPPASSFLDTFDRPNASTLGSGWVIVNLGYNAGVQPTACVYPSINANCLKATGAGIINPNATINTLFMPVANGVNLGIYSKSKVFIEVVWDSTGGGGMSWGLILRCNWENLNGSTNPPFTDFYRMFSGGQIDRVVGGGTATTIGAGTWGAISQGDLLRFEVENTPQGGGLTSVILRSIRNGTLLQAITDTAPGNILTGFGGITPFGLAGTPVNDTQQWQSCRMGTY